MKLSIIIPTYNDFKKLKNCLQSIAEQSFKDYEIIVVDDGSKIDPTSYIKELKKSLEFEFYRIEHGGAPKARNFGFSKSSGEYLLFLDADVCWLDNLALQKMVDVLDSNPDMSFVYSSFKFGWKTFPCGKFSSDRLKENNYISGNSMLRRVAFPGWDESLKRFQDWDLWLTIVENGGRGQLIPEVLWQAQTGGTMSKWLPSFLYKLPWLKSVKEYNAAKKIIKDKHNL